MPDITAEKVQEMLLEEERREKETGETFGAKALALRKKGGNLWCTECSKSGHEASGCWQLHPELAPEHLQEIMREKYRKKGGYENVTM